MERHTVTRAQGAFGLCMLFAAAACPAASQQPNDGGVVATGGFVGSSGGTGGTGTPASGGAMGIDAASGPGPMDGDGVATTDAADASGPVDAAAEKGGAATDAPLPMSSVPMFVAQGWVGRTTISCDDGQTWVANRSDNDALRCYGTSNGPDCDHATTAARGITYGAGWFFASFGWGEPGSVRRSRDGVAWEVVLPSTGQGTMAFGNGRVLGQDWYSDDLGLTWKATAQSNAGTNRTTGFITQGGGRHVLFGDDGTFVNAGAASKVAGAWSKVQGGCGNAFEPGTDVAISPSVAVLVGTDGRACRSTDGGLTWSSVSVGGPTTSHTVWDGSAFRVWGVGKAYQSADGATWTSINTVPANLKIQAVARNSDTGTFVAVREEWQEWYDLQAFYRSADGVRWTAIAKSNFSPSHRILDIQFGYGVASTVCPGR